MTVKYNFIHIYKSVLEDGNSITVYKQYLQPYLSAATWKISNKRSWILRKIYTNLLFIVPIKIYALPFTGYISKARPDKFLAQVQKIIPGRTPKCNFLFCSKETKYGYRKCDTHRAVCQKCRIKEPDINDNGFNRCYDCPTTRYF